MTELEDIFVGIPYKRLLDAIISERIRAFSPLGRPGPEGHPRGISRHDAGDDENYYGETKYHEDRMDSATCKETDESHLLLDDEFSRSP